MFLFVETVGVRRPPEIARAQIGQRLAAAIRRAGISQRQLAEQIGFAPSTLTNWVKGANQPPLEVLVELCQLVGASSDEILGLDTGAPKIDTGRLTARIDRLEARVRGELEHEVAALRAEIDRLKG